MIEVVHLKKEYENVVPIKDISFTVNKGDAISIIGPSGTGKSTLLRMINMLERPTSGKIIIDGEDITVPGFPLHTIRGKVGMVFQNYSLFNHLTVIENICYAPIKLKGMAPDAAYKRGMELLASMGLTNFALSYPSSLSGGQKQRAAIARTLAMDPEVILFDEPTSALDPTMVDEVELVIKKLVEDGYTLLIVTHDMKFAETVANRTFYLDEGGIYEEGSPEVIFNNPLKEKTKAFVKRLKSFNCDITDENSDYMKFYTELNKFCYKHEISRDKEKALKSVFEELCFQILIPSANPESKIHFVADYFSTKESIEVKCNYSNLDINLEDEKFSIQMGIIKHFAKDFKIKTKAEEVEISFSL